MNVPAKRRSRDRVSEKKTRREGAPNESAARVLCFGEVLWDLHTPIGQTFEAALELEMQPGGGAVNVAKHLQSLGIRAAIAGAVGADPLGRALKARLANMAIDVANLVETKLRTGLVLLSKSPFAAVAYRSTNDEAKAWQSALPKQFDATIFHISGLLPSNKLALALMRAMRRARKQGCLVTLDANVRPKLWTEQAQAHVDLLGVFREADLVKASDDDLRVLGCADARALASKLQSDAILVITHGARGATAVGPFGEIHEEAKPLALASALGAGDAFMAGLVATLTTATRARSLDALREALARGNAHAYRWLQHGH